MTIYIPIWKHMRDALPTIDDAVISKLREMFTTNNADVSVKKPGKWVIALTDLHRVDEFIKEESNIKIAEAHVAGLMMGAGGAKARASRFTVEIEIEGNKITLHSEEKVQELVTDLVRVNEEQFKELEDLREKMSRLGSPVHVSMPFFTFSDATVSEENSLKLEELAQKIALHPEIFFGIKGKEVIYRSIVNLAKSEGLTTMRGRPWTIANIRNYSNWLKNRVSAIMQENQKKHGKIRVRLSGKAV